MQTHAPYFSVKLASRKIIYTSINLRNNDNLSSATYDSMRELTALKHAKPYTASDSIGVAFPQDEYHGFVNPWKRLIEN